MIIQNQAKEIILTMSPQLSPQRSNKIQKSYLNSGNAFNNIRLNSECKPLPSISNRSFIKKTGPIRGKYRTYTDQIKEEAINLFRQFQDLRFVSRALRVPIKNIDRWVKHGVTRKKGGQVISWAETDEHEFGGTVRRVHELVLVATWHFAEILGNQGIL